MEIRKSPKQNSKIRRTLLCLILNVHCVLNLFYSTKVEYLRQCTFFKQFFFLLKLFIINNNYNLSFPANSNKSVKNKRTQKCLENRKLIEFLHRHVPITSWFPNYNAEKATGDLIAGLTIGMTMIPQSIAYASLANLSPQVCFF